MRLRLPRFRLTLRVLFLLVAVIAVVIGWHARNLHLRRQAVHQITAKGGTLYYEHERFQYEPPGPAWIRWIIGDDAFAKGSMVVLKGNTFTDEDVELLSLFPTLSIVDLIAIIYHRCCVKVGLSPA
jgi:hypothetical protein